MVCYNENRHVPVAMKASVHWHPGPMQSLAGPNFQQTKPGFLRRPVIRARLMTSNQLAR
ncbi:hypothetical protein RvY_18173 [Ramazzottius varieornatus]|uniref:Uncharacterized protein n=1 Tax=Ramazzottius varieornatus TaxID=947166 RepID=A0A1D1W4W5_RAMVA|nr:hypothetical protein RvY_18173 [Ramazzottius varieornatus]